MRAEADPAYLAYGYAGLPYAAAYPYAAAVTYNGVPFGSSSGLDAITQGLDPVTQGVSYPAYHYLGKREAEAEPEAEADPAYLTYGYAAGLPYSYGYSAALPYAAAYTAAYPYSYGFGYPYAAAGYHYLGKREAEAEADPAYLTYGYVPFGSSTGLDPITQGLDASTQGYAPYAYAAYAPYAATYAGYGYPWAGGYGK